MQPIRHFDFAELERLARRYSADVWMGQRAHRHHDAAYLEKWALPEAVIEVDRL